MVSSLLVLDSPFVVNTVCDSNRLSEPNSFVDIKFQFDGSVK